MPAKPLIAVVDDDLPVRRALGRLLSSAGFEARLFASGSELLESPVRDGTSCILMDIHLVGLDGFEVCDRLRESGVHAAVIFMTARDSEETRARARAYERSAYLRKPFEASALLGGIRAAIAASEPAPAS